MKTNEVKRALGNLVGDTVAIVYDEPNNRFNFGQKNLDASDIDCIVDTYDSFSVTSLEDAPENVIETIVDNFSCLNSHERSEELSNEELIAIIRDQIDSDCKIFLAEGGEESIYILIY